MLSLTTIVARVERKFLVLPVPWHYETTPRLIRNPFSTLRKDANSVSVVELALVMPLFMTLGMYGAEIAWLNAASMELNQVAVSLADNASRLGQTDNSGVTQTISVDDVASALDGALVEGTSVNLEDNGRVILSSLEAHPVTGRQYIHWQQYSGKGKQQSKQGKPDLTGSLLTSLVTGLKLNGRNITAPSGSSVMRNLYTPPNPRLARRSSSSLPSASPW